MIKHISVFALLGSVLAGCAVDSASFEEAAETEQAIGDSCASAPATLEVPGGVDYTPSRSEYDTQGCFKAQVVDITNLSAKYVGPGSLRSGGIYLTWADTLPGDEVSCDKSLIRALLFEKQSTGWKLLTDKPVFGNYHDATDTWQAFCMAPALSFTKEVGADGKLLWELKAGKTYRVAFTGRNAANATQKVNIRTESPLH